MYIQQSLWECKPDVMEEEMKSILKKIREIKIEKKSDCFIGETEIIRKWLFFIPLLGELKDRSMRPRHWEAITNVLKRPDRVSPETLLSILWESELFRHSDSVGEITDQAKQEGKMESFLKKLDQVKELSDAVS